MKNYFVFSPPIEHIGRRHLGVTDGLIEAVERGDASPGIIETVRQTPDWAEHQADIKDVQAHIEVLTAESQPPPILPDHIRDFIRRRIAVNSLTFESLPAPGQIILVERIVTPRPGQLDAVLTSPLHVLLDAPAEAPAVWHGWLVSGETDYAGWWDFVLQEQDAPFDPEAAMVQLWNPVPLYLPMAARVVGQLSAARLQAVRSLAVDFVTSVPPVEVPIWPGRVASRTTASGLNVTTGSPLGDTQDLRHRYQQIYFEAAEAIREPARLALRTLADVPTTHIGTLLSRFIAAAGRLAEVLVPEPRVAVAMTGDDAAEVPDLSWPGIARFRILDFTDEGDGRIEVTAIGGESVTVEVRRDALVEDHVVIAPGASQIVSWGGGSTTLAFATPSGRKLDLGLSHLS
jgi:hypothetical protein